MTPFPFGLEMASPNSKQLPGQQTRKLKLRRPKQSIPRNPSFKPTGRRLNDPQLNAMSVKYKEVSKGVSGRNQQLMRQYMLPSSVASPILSPALSSAQLCPRIIRAAYVLQPTDIDANGGAMILMKPSIDGPAYVTTPGATTFPATPAPFSSAAENIGINSDGYVKGMLHNKTMDSELEAISRSAIVTLGGIARECWDFNYPSGTPVHWSITPKTKDTGFIPKFYSSDGAAWYVGTGVAGSAMTYPTTNNGTFTLGANSRYLAVRLETESGGGHSAPCQIDLNMVTGDQTHDPFLNISGSTTVLYSKFKKAAVVDKISSGRLCSMSMLVSNVTQELKKQGEIYIGRLQPEVLHHELVDLPAHIIAQNENRRYHGPAAQGGYTWWMADNDALQAPGPLREFDVIARDEEVLFCYLRGLDPASSFSIEFTWYIEFFTTNQLFEKRVTPPYGNFSDVLHALSLAPAATCNPEHFETLKGIIKSAAGLGNSAYEHYSKHKVLYDTVLQTLAGMLV